MAAVRAAVKFGSAVMAAVAALTDSAIAGGMPECSFCGANESDCWPSSGWPKTCGRDGGCGGRAENWAWNGTAATGCCSWYCSGLGLFVRSNVTVGNGADADMLVMLDEQTPGRMDLARKL